MILVLCEVKIIHLPIPMDLLLGMLCTHARTQRKHERCAFCAKSIDSILYREQGKFIDFNAYLSRIRMVVCWHIRWAESPVPLSQFFSLGLYQGRPARPQPAVVHSALDFMRASLERLLAAVAPGRSDTKDEFDAVGCARNNRS